MASAGSAASEYERERNSRIRENNRLLKSLGLLATDFAVASATDKLPVLGDLLPDPPASVDPKRVSVAGEARRLSFATVPPLELPDLRDVDAYRRTVVAVAVELAGRLCLGG